jgi:hypothetical protein
MLQEAFHNLYSSENIIRVIRLEKMRNAHKIFIIWALVAKLKVIVPNGNRTLVFEPLHSH